MSSIFPVLVVLSLVGPPADLAVAEAALSQSWELISNRGLSESGLFDLTIEAIDPALGGDYFPSGPPLNRFGEPGGIRPLPRWTDAAATQGHRYLFTSELFPTGPLAVKQGSTSKFFDGQHSWIYEPRQRLATRFLGASSNTRQPLGYYRDMVGFPAGSVLGTRSTPGDLREPYRLDLLIPSAQYTLVGSEVVDGLSCVVMERPGLDKIWLVPNFGWALARRDWRWSINGPLKRKITNRDFRQVTSGFWLPFAGTMEIYASPATKPSRRVGLLRVKLEAAEVDVPDERFSPDFPAGTTITDRETGENTRFGPDPGPNAKTVYQLGPVFRPLPWWRRAWMPWMIASILMAIGAAWMIRRRSVG